MGFDVSDAFRRDGGRRVGRRQQGFLGLSIRRHEAIARAVVVDGGAGDDRVDAATGGDGRVERLEHRDPRALAAHVAVGARVEGLAPGVGGEHAGGVERAGGGVFEHDADAAR